MHVSKTTTGIRQERNGSGVIFLSKWSRNVFFGMDVAVKS